MTAGLFFRTGQQGTLRNGHVGSTIVSP